MEKEKIANNIYKKLNLKSQGNLKHLSATNNWDIINLDLWVWLK